MEVFKKLKNYNYFLDFPFSQSQQIKAVNQNIQQKQPQIDYSNRRLKDQYIINKEVQLFEAKEMSKRIYQKDSINNENFVTKRGNAYYKKKSYTSNGLSQSISIDNSMHLNPQVRQTFKQNKNLNDMEIEDLQEKKNNYENTSRKKLLYDGEIDEESQFTYKNQTKLILEYNKINQRVEAERPIKQERQFMMRQSHNYDFKIEKKQKVQMNKSILQRFKCIPRNPIKKQPLIRNLLKPNRLEHMIIQVDSDIDTQPLRESYFSNSTDISIQQ